MTEIVYLFLLIYAGMTESEDVSDLESEGLCRVGSSPTTCTERDDNSRLFLNVKFKKTKRR